MSDNNILEQLRNAVLEEAVSNPTEEDVEEFMSAQTNSSPDILPRMRKQFVEKVLGKLHPEPIRQVEKDLTLGQLIQAEREKARLTQSFVATALGVDTSFIEQLEKGDILPWTVPAAKGAEIAILFQIHFNAFCQLIANSYKSEKRIEQSPSSSSKTETKGMHISRPSDEELCGDIKDRLKAVHFELESKQAMHLLS